MFPLRRWCIIDNDHSPEVKAQISFVGNLLSRDNRVGTVARKIRIWEQVHRGSDVTEEKWVEKSRKIETQGSLDHLEPVADVPDLDSTLFS
jgi:hypothetical protein